MRIFTYDAAAMIKVTKGKCTSELNLRDMQQQHKLGLLLCKVEGLVSGMYHRVETYHVCEVQYHI